MYTRDTVITVEPFTRQMEGEEVIIGRVETGVFLAVPCEAVEVLDDLAQGKTIGETSDIYLQKHGETPDLEEFLQILESKGIVKTIAQGNNGSKATAAHPGPRVRYVPAGYAPKAAREFRW